MKVRVSFVSNSSSSSFVMIMLKETHEKAMESMTPYGQEVVKQLIYYGPRDFAGINIVIVAESTGGGYSILDDLCVSVEPSEDDKNKYGEISNYSVFEKYKSLIPKDQLIALDI